MRRMIPSDELNVKLIPIESSDENIYQISDLLPYMDVANDENGIRYSIKIVTLYYNYENKKVYPDNTQLYISVGEQGVTVEMNNIYYISIFNSENDSLNIVDVYGDSEKRYVTNEYVTGSIKDIDFTIDNYYSHKLKIYKVVE